MKPWLVLVLLAACTSFDAVPRNVCGNGVLEPGEDCDSTDATCVRCAVTCAKAADCPSSEYSCGVDGLCHAPLGALATPVEGGLFLVDDYKVTDVDHDKIGDVVGVSRTSLVVRHGDVGAALTRTDAQVTPSQTGPAAFGDVDNDGTLDVTMVTADGLVTYASPFGTLSPLDVTQTVGTGAMSFDGRDLFTVGPLAVGAFVVDGNTGNVLIGVVDFGVAAANQIQFALPCGAVAAADFSPDLVDVYQVNQDGDVATDIVVALTSRNGKLCVMAIHKDSIVSTATLTPITQPNPPSLSTKPVLADLDNDNDRCPDVITSEAGPRMMRHWPGAMVGGHCTLSGVGDLLPSMDAEPPSAHPFGHASFGAGFSTPDGIVMPDGIWGFGGTSWTQVYASPRPISLAATGDLDGDGRPDVVIGGGGTNDLDVLYRTNNPFASFQLYRVPTAAPVTSITIGDFDGDGNKDLDYTEHVGDHERMMVAYDQVPRLATPVEVGTFASVVAVARVALPSNADPSFQTNDLIVLQSLSGVPALTILVGSAQRTMIPYYDPRSDAIQKTTVLRTASVGSFTGMPYRDVIAIATPKPTQQGDATARGWGIKGPVAQFNGTKSDGTLLAGAVDCSHDFGTGWCAEEASYFAFPATGHDVVIAVDQTGKAIRMDIGGTSPSADRITQLAPPAAEPAHQLAAADLDGDGTAELIATFDGAVFVCKVDGTGLPTACTEVGAMTGATCTDATAVKIPTLALVAACHDASGGVLYKITDNAGAFTAEVLARSSDDLRYVRGGDVNGDGLDDVVAASGDRGNQTLVVFPQCSTRDIATCQLGAHK